MTSIIKIWKNSIYYLEKQIFNLQKILTIIIIFNYELIVTKNFVCPRELLVAEMQYFAECLPQEISSPDDIDISVHCDIKIFQWLMEYVKSNDNDNVGLTNMTAKPKLGMKHLRLSFIRILR